jgi:hypothetical protein
MDCSKAQQLWHERDRLSEPVAAELHRHLADCSDCRVARQRAVRLQQLLSLKRHETPGPAYFAGFVGEFHRRLAAAEAQPAWYERILPAVSFESPLWRYGFTAAATASILVAALFYWQGTELGPVTRAATEPATQMVAIATRPAPVVTPSVILMPEAPNASSQPRYVLDRITITPASYEPGSVRF